MTQESGTQYDLVVIGGGPAGYQGALRAARLGLRVACIEKEPQLGGTCLRVGCIPSKALLESSEKYEEALHGLAMHGVRAEGVSFDLPAMMARKQSVVDGLAGGIDYLFKQHHIDRYFGWGSIVEPHVVLCRGQEGEILLRTRFILIATGSRPLSLPGIEVDADRIGFSSQALDYPKVPETMIVIGAGYIGLELGSVWRRLGAQVLVLEYLNRILPGMDAELAKVAQRHFQKQGIQFQLGAKVTAAYVKGDKAVVEIEGNPPKQAERVLVAVGRGPNTEHLGLEGPGIEIDKRGRILVNEHWETSVPGIFAVGDVIPGPMLAHKAECEAVACVERLVTGYGYINYDAIPGVCYTMPEIATVGRTEEELREANIPYKKGICHMKANGRARVLGQDEGLAKILAHAQTDRVLGVHIIGPRAGDLIAEATAAIQFGASAEELAHMVHAHPTLPETIKDAAFAIVEGH